MNWTQIFRENLNCYALSIFRVFILLASSDSDMHNVNEPKSVSKDSPIAPQSIKVRGSPLTISCHTLMEALLSPYDEGHFLESIPVCSPKLSSVGQG